MAKTGRLVSSFVNGLVQGGEAVVSAPCPDTRDKHGRVARSEWAARDSTLNLLMRSQQLWLLC